MERLLCLLSNMNMGGAETFLMKVFRGLDRSRYRMDFCIVLKEKCDYEDEILDLGGKVYRIPSKSQNSKAFKDSLYALIHDHHYQNVLKITSNAAGFWDLKIAKKAGAGRTIARSSNSSDGENPLHTAIHYLSRALWSRYVDVKIAPSDLAAIHTFGKRAVKRGEVRFLNNGLDLDVYRFDPDARRRLRAEFNAGEHTVVLGHVGRFNTQKNHRFLVRVFAEYVKQNEDALLILTGVGTLEDEIRQQVNELCLDDKVVFTGLRSDIPQLLSAFDVYVFPSLYEGMPNTVIEAQACGLPCVIADTITKQADLSGQVRFLPISDPAVWVPEITKLASCGRIDADMSAYDIKEAVRQFCEDCFGSVGENAG